MIEVSLEELVARGHATRVEGDASVRVRGVRHDSRVVEPGDLFVAVPGGTRDGASFVGDAVARGAVAVLAEHAVHAPIPTLVARDVLRALSAIARDIYGDPTAGMHCVGITGTNGKTTTAYLVEAIVHAAGGRPAVVGTVEVRGPAGVRPTAHTTPMADDLMRHARWAADAGATHLVLEVSSHGLAMHRADAVRFEVAAFTNLTQDHLDYHGDLASYARAKARLFEDLAPRHAVINVDDGQGAKLAAAFRGLCMRCSRGLHPDAEIFATNVRIDASGIVAHVRTPAGEGELRSPLAGEHNLENLLVALGCGLALGFSLEVVLGALASAKGAPGRLERVGGAEPSVFVDYAHTPDALERVLHTLRSLTRGRVIVVFGCGGDRDASKRPKMGTIAAKLADLAIATSDNPRSESPARILSAIESGLLAGGGRALTADELAHTAHGYHVCEDRRAAIGAAVAAARPSDVVLIAGKGHEKYQVVGDRREPFDDCEEARLALARRSGEA